MIYVDNAATSYPKPKEVLRGVSNSMSIPLGNPGRASHKAAVDAMKSVFKARQTISEFFNIENFTRIAFVKNATEALNTAIFGVLHKGDHVITTSMEHNSVLRPLKYLESQNMIELSIVFGDECGIVDAQNIFNAIKPKTKLIVITYSSNVNGITTPVKQVGQFCKDNGILFLLDASQGAGSDIIDVKELNVDLMAFPGHKGLMGPQGTGGLYVKDKIDIKPLLMGGTGSLSESLEQPDFMPDRLESGTLNVPGIVGLKCGIDFINSVGINKIREHKNKLVNRFIKEIKSINEVEIFSQEDILKNTGIVSIRIKDIDSNEVSYLLDKMYNIKVRAGFHCAPLAHKTLRTSDTGLVRFSFGYFNNVKEIDFCTEAIYKIIKKYLNTL